MNTIVGFGFGFKPIKLKSHFDNQQLHKILRKGQVNENTQHRHTHTLTHIYTQNLSRFKQKFEKFDHI